MTRGLDCASKNFWIWCLLFFCSNPLSNARTANYSPGTLSLRMGVFSPEIPLRIDPPLDSTLQPLIYEQNVAARLVLLEKLH